VIAFDILRPPSLFDQSAAAYKDWLHFNFFDHESGAIGLVNVSLHGSPEDERSRAIGTALVHLPSGALVGNVEVQALRSARIGWASIGLPEVMLGVSHLSGTVLASAQMSGDGLVLDITAQALTSALNPQQRFPLGPGWVSWYVVPRLEVSGAARVDGVALELDRAVGYTDHNWGRWHWGDDLGWECAILAAPGADGLSFVITRTTNRRHDRVDSGSLVVRARGRQRTFSGPRIAVSTNLGRYQLTRRLPGSLAALHQDHLSPLLPRTAVIAMDNGQDRVRIEFRGESAMQLIAADPDRRGYSFIHEIFGEFVASGVLGAFDFTTGGLGVFEYVN
jgi:hypothetical protein